MARSGLLAVPICSTWSSASYSRFKVLSSLYIRCVSSLSIYDIMWDLLAASICSLNCEPFWIQSYLGLCQFWSATFSTDRSISFAMPLTLYREKFRVLCIFWSSSSRKVFVYCYTLSKLGWNWLPGIFAKWTLPWITGPSALAVSNWYSSSSSLSYSSTLLGNTVLITPKSSCSRIV